MATPIDIVNMALRRIGADRISAFEDAQEEARATRDIYDEIRREVLNAHNWNFAIKRAQLSSVATAPAFGWDYAYELPHDLVRIVSVHSHNDDDSSVEYRLEFQDGSDRVLVTNSNQIFIRYVFDNEDVNVWSAAFRNVMGWRLAVDLAQAVSKSTATAEMCGRKFSTELSRAKAIDGIEDWPERLADGSWLTARYPDYSRA